MIDKIPKVESRVRRFERLGYGMFIHWGLYSQLGRGEWIRHNQKIAKEEYAKLAETFDARDFDAREIAAIARAAGMKYITLTTRHHDGFSLFDTRGLCTFDAPNSAAKRDLVMEFTDACREEGLVPFYYHTTLDWYQESFENNFSVYLDYLNQSIEILCRNYGEIGGFWFDGNWSKPDADWKEDELYSIIRKYQPDAIIINNTGLSHRGEPGHPEIDSVTFERGHPSKMDRRGMGKYLASETCQTMNQHWGIGRNDFAYLSPLEIIESLSACRKVGSNYLLNVGLTATGNIPGYERETLLRVGNWVEKYADIICDAEPTDIVGTGKDFVLSHCGKLYLFIHDLGVSGDANVAISGSEAGARVFANFNRPVKNVRWLDNDESLAFSDNGGTGRWVVNATDYPYGVNLVVRVAEVELGDG